jgi:predicted NBD/HSP70 family sugar kinase
MYRMKHCKTQRERDLHVIEALVRRFGALSQVEIHELTHLQRSAISGLARDLLKQGRLVEAGRSDNSIGRKRILLRLNEEHGFILGVGFDDEAVLAAVMDLRPRIHSMVREATRLAEGMEGLEHQLLSCAHEAIRQAGLRTPSLLGIGIAGSGLVNSQEGTMVMSSTIESFRHVPLRSIFEKEFAVPVLLANFARAKAVAERTLGAGAMADDMIYVEYGKTGIGAGIISGGKLIHGAGFAAGELGHTHITEEGPPCKCGSFGCLEALAGAAAIEARIRKAIAEGSGSEVVSLAGDDPAGVSGWMVLKAAEKGDKTCAAIVEQAANYLGLGLANLVNLFNPSVLILDQRLKLAGQGLLQQIVKVVKRQALSYSNENVSISFGSLGAEASVLGAGSIALEKYFEIPALKPPRFLIESVSGPPHRGSRLGTPSIAGSDSVPEFLVSRPLSPNR